MTVVGFGSFRGDADVNAGACLGCETVARQASLPRVGCRRFHHRRGDRLVAAVGYGADADRYRADANRDCRKRRERSVAAIAARQSGDAAALPPARPDLRLRQSSRRRRISSPRRRASVRRRSTAVPTASAPATPASTRSTHRAAKRKSRCKYAAPGAIVPQQPETTFTPVPTFNPARTSQSPGSAEAAAAGDLSAESGDTARRDLAAFARRIAGEQSAGRSASRFGGQPARRRRAGAAAGIFQLSSPIRLQSARRRRRCSRPTRLRWASGRNACCRSWRSPILMRRSAFAPDRSCCCRRSICRRPTAPIRTRARRSAFRLRRRRAGVESAIRLGAPLAQCRFQRLLYAICREPVALAQRALHEFQDRRAHRRHARNPDQSAIARHRINTDNPGSPNLSAQLA